MGYNEVCVFSHGAPLGPYLPLTADLQLARRLGHGPVRRPAQLCCHRDRSLRPVGVDVGDLAAEHLPVLSPGPAPPAALRPLPHVPAVGQSQRNTEGDAANVCSSLRRCSSAVNLRIEHALALCHCFDRSYYVRSVHPGPKGNHEASGFSRRRSQKMKAKYANLFCTNSFRLLLVISTDAPALQTSAAAIPVDTYISN